MFSDINNNLVLLFTFITLEMLVLTYYKLW